MLLQTSADDNYLPAKHDSCAGLRSHSRPPCSFSLALEALDRDLENFQLAKRTTL